jgi:Peptidase A4 family
MKTNHMILAVVVAALFSVLPHASAQQDDDGIPTNLPGVTTAPAPPSGFNPLTASDSELVAYGFPPRPDKNASPKEYANWANAMMAAKERIFPELELTNHVHSTNAGAGSLANGTIPCPANINSTSTCVGNAYWSGVVETTTATSYGPNSFSFVQADFVVPVANFEPGQYGKFQCPVYPYHSSSWVGIDGYGSNDVLQAGTEADVSCINGNPQGNYYAWFDWACSPSVGVCPGETRIMSFPVTAGQDIQVLVSVTLSQQGKQQGNIFR